MKKTNLDDLMKTVLISLLIYAVKNMQSSITVDENWPKGMLMSWTMNVIIAAFSCRR